MKIITVMIIMAVYLGSVFALIELILMVINQKISRNKRRFILVLQLVIEMKIIMTVTLIILVNLQSVKVMDMKRNKII
jgi:NADH:ubiquinone oxidoreductase subunit 6 (subunit J)